MDSLLGYRPTSSTTGVQPEFSDPRIKGERTFAQEVIRAMEDPRLAALLAPGMGLVRVPGALWGIGKTMGRDFMRMLPEERGSFNPAFQNMWERSLEDVGKSGGYSVPPSSMSPSGAIDPRKAISEYLDSIMNMNATVRDMHGSNPLRRSVATDLFEDSPEYTQKALDDVWRGQGALEQWLTQARGATGGGGGVPSPVMKKLLGFKDTPEP